MRQPFRILFVCTGNMCRSPLAERLTASWLARVGPPAANAIGVASAGTHAVVGAAMYPDTAAVLRRLGGDPAGFAARQLTGQIIDAADLILTAARAHREIAGELLPAAAARTFTLREFAALAAATGHRGGTETAEAGDVAARARALTAAAALARGELAGWPPSKIDVPDPVGQPMAVQEAAAALIADAIAGPLGLIAGAAGHFATPVRMPSPDSASLRERGPL
jgi:low molecular weight protein-tyrosine phosphatase